MSPTKRRPAGVQGRADLHIHTMASDGTAGVAQVLARAEEARLDVIAITDHDRIDAARAAQAMAIKNKLRVQVIVGEEISTLQGHVLGLFLEERVRPLRSLRRTIAEIHEQGGIAIPAHPLFPHPLCAQEGAIRAAANDRDPACRPDGLETYNPTIFGTSPRRRVGRLAADLGEEDGWAMAAEDTVVLCLAETEIRPAVRRIGLLARALEADLRASAELAQRLGDIEALFLLEEDR